ncbi:acyl-CoA thioesterase [Sphingorhabdus sp. IMCC26285]|uniref:Acyl-CoA thioesterase n=1 Tax=Sphingorhabdus profundilacus TaxID=2509718 RepID=A0A6I4M690_9SPHN|nr:acyl-CoA thioesterase [Sphingorhabdus profundilacus]
MNDNVRNLPKRSDPVLRVIPGPSDINANGHIFGGWVLGVMDQAGGIVAGRVSQGACATVAIEKMEFIAPILLRDIISVYASLERRGRTSMGIRIEVIATRERGQQEVKVTEGLFTFVALDEQHKPRPLPER